MTSPQESPSVDLSIVIPTFNEAEAIGGTLDALARLQGRKEVIVADGGSLDATIEIARRRGVRVITAERGRGSQMHAGASIARGQVLWFLHADTIPPADAPQQIIEALKSPEVVLGNFTITFDGQSRAARFLTWLYPHLRKIGLCYGDSAIFLRRETYERVGGFRPFPIFEDLELVKRLRRSGRMVHLASAVVCSSRRFERRSFVLQFTRWSMMHVLYWLGVNPHLLGRHYAPIRRPITLEPQAPSASRSLDLPRPTLEESGW